MRRMIYPMIAAVFAVVSCIDPIPAEGDEELVADRTPPLSEVAVLLSSLQLDADHLKEVHDAVSSSSENGYDEEYTMSYLFSDPGAGVGDELLSSKAGRTYRNPLSGLIRDYLNSVAAAGGLSGTKSSGGCGLSETKSGSVVLPGSVEEYISALSSSDIQIYWPYSEDWDGETMPVITFDPEDDTSLNVGYQLCVDENGDVYTEEVTVDEEFAMEHPVWVVNRNNDDEYMSLEMLRNLGPGTVVGGGEVVVMPGGGASSDSMTKSGEDAPLRTLLVRDFTMKRNYDSWFAGASEFFVKCGAVENFTASTEAELKLYSPSVTDFMIVVKRRNVGVAQEFNAVLVSEWTDQLDNCALMIVEDDGGTTTSWKCKALVRISSKSYGVELDLPFRTRDDIVWRGSLSSKYFEQNNCVTGHFGDVDITFELYSE